MTITYGSYTLDRELGKGGMGVVYAGVHKLLGRRAAIKVLRPELSRDPELVRRFFTEAQAATAIKHPSIVEVYDFGFADDGAAFIVMELLDGESLAARLARRPLPIDDVLGFGRQVATALAAAHRAGIVHRDLKPDNVFLVGDPEVPGGERVKLLDFGIAKLLAGGVVGGDTPQVRTVTQGIVGTPQYMSPEQCEGSREVDARSDLYSLGCVLFQMASGRLPFEAAGIGGLIGMHLHVAPPRLATVCPQAPPELDALVAQLLAKAPADRPASADEVARVLGGAPVTERLPPPAGEVAYAPTITPDRTMPDPIATLATEVPRTPPPPPARAPRPAWLLPLGVALAILLVLAVVWEVHAPSIDVAIVADAVPVPVPMPLPMPAPIDALLVVPIDALIDGPVDAPIDARPRHHDAAPPTPDAPPASTDADADEQAELRRAINDEMRNGSYETIIRMCELLVTPPQGPLYECTVAACKVHDLARVARYGKQLDAKHKKDAQDFCEDVSVP